MPSLETTSDEVSKAFCVTGRYKRSTMNFVSPAWKKWEHWEDDLVKGTANQSINEKKLRYSWCRAKVLSSFSSCKIYLTDIISQDLIFIWCMTTPLAFSFRLFDCCLDLCSVGIIPARYYNCAQVLGCCCTAWLCKWFYKVVISLGSS